MIDTGARISELLKLEKNNVDLEQMLIALTGKGKERIVPMSFELRKVLYKYLERKEIKYSRLVFPSRRGGEMYYQDIHFQMSNLLHSLRIPVKGFHAFRRKFARNYLKNGGNLMYLMKAMGHTKITTTQRYLEVETEELTEIHFRTSLLSRLR
jgi:site-specific recombinase XerD